MFGLVRRSACTAVRSSTHKHFFSGRSCEVWNEDGPSVALNVEMRDLQWAKDHPLVLIQHLDVVTDGRITTESLHRLLEASGLSGRTVEILIADIGEGGIVTVNTLQKNIETFVSVLGQARTK